MELLIQALTDRSASLLSIESLREDLQVSHNTLSRWLEILERLYICFRIAPFGSPKIRAVKKEKKLYLWDWAETSESGPRFENMLACQLLKYCHFIEDTEGYPMELRYIRDREGREIDFVVLKKGKAQFAVECKISEVSLSKHIKYFQQRIKIPEFYQVHLKEKDIGFADRGGRSLPFWKFCEIKKMP